MKLTLSKFIAIVAGISFLSGCQNTNKFELTIAKIFSDHMVLQRDVPVRIWGTATPGTKIRVSISSMKGKTKADKSGNWLIEIPAMSAGGPFVLTINNGKKIILTDILIGDVWLASGQSNMEFSLQSSNNAKQEIADAVNYPNIRLFSVPRTLAAQPREDLSGGEWYVCDSASAKSFSAVAYFFGKHLNRELGVPIGLINSSWGGSPAESWTSREKIITIPAFERRIWDLETKNITDSILEVDLRNEGLWWDLANNSNEGLALNVISPEYSDKDWEEMKIPQTIDDSKIGPFEGIIWFRKSVMLKKTHAGKNLILRLGKIALKDVTYFNGQKIGESPYNEDVVRTYPIPSGLVREGLNVITIRVTDLWGSGGLNGPSNNLFIGDHSQGDKPLINLAGQWKYNEKIEPKLPDSEGYYQAPAFIFNGMIAPIVQFAIKGAIWYQGEANAGRAYQYRTSFPLMINDWRERWHEGDFPFLFVQLANYSPSPKEPAESDWAELREAQGLTLNYPNTGMAVAIDIGDPLDIHPTNKQDVGKRLALAAEKIAYGRDVVFSGPVYDTMDIEGTKVRLRFNHTGSGLVSKGNEKLTGFSISGNDKKFYWADAIIEGPEIIVSSPRVANPVAVRYGWASSPECNLYNKEGLPASPFRTDDWPGVTLNNE